MRSKKILAAGAAAAAVIGVAGCSGTGFGGDISINNPILGTLNNNEIVAANMQVRTNDKPRAFEAYIYLQYRKGSTGAWSTEAEKIAHITDLPPIDGKYHTLAQLVAFCAKGQWRIEMHVTGTSSTGQGQNIYYYFPGPSSSSAGKNLC
jgi:hypothetical protein